VPSLNEAVIAAAGSGKTTRIVQQAIRSASERCAMVTFTLNNTEETQKRLYELNSSIPDHIEVRSWYSFLLRELARPYQNFLYQKRIDGMSWSQGRSTPYVKKSNIGRFYFGNGNHIYSDKVSQFVCDCNQASKGAVIRRLEQRFDRIYIDELQDLAGHDLELLELLLKSRIKLTLVGDHRQSTFRTNNASKNKAYWGFNIIKKLEQWKNAGLCGIRYETETRRCNQAIANLADAFFPSEPKTTSKNDQVTGHDGVFLVSREAVDQYVANYRPQVLRLDKRTDCGGYEAKNLGDSKGLTFERVLIFPHKLAQSWLSTGDFEHVAKTASRLYVGITRARYSVAFVHDGNTPISGIARHS
jgi:DNA helicase-2/ATP-dependent DNA helicase PcrA